jgi:hypothetical protein
MYLPLVKSDANDAAGENRLIGDCAARDSWPDFVRAFRDPARALFRPWDELFAPLRVGAIDDLVVVGQIGRLMGASPPSPAIRATSTARRGSPICIDCARWSMPCSSASARRSPTIRN